MEPLVAEIERRFAELEAQLGDPAVLADQRRYAGVAREHKRLSAAAELARQWRERTTQVADAAELANDPDEDMRAFAQEQVLEAREALPALEEEIRLAMLERDPADDKDVIVELRAGTGGDEAAIFAGNLYEMLTRYAQQRGFKTDTLAASGRRRGRLQGARVRDPRRRRLLGVQVRERRAPGAARPRDRVAGPHPHVDGDRGGAARGRGRRVPRRSERPAHRRLPRRRATAASRSTPPTRPCASRTSRRTRSSPARTSARSSRTRSGR